jgi:hypothetical protein
MFIQLRWKFILCNFSVRIFKKLQDSIYTSKKSGR